MKLRDSVPTADNCTNMNGFGTCAVGTTLENLKAAITGETGASAKYRAFSKAAADQGYDQISRLFAATAEAEQIHISLESALVLEVEPDFVLPEPPAAEGVQTDLNLISGAQGEIFETSDMYPAFIKKAQEEGNTKAVQVFTRAKLAESVHAERYLNAYNDIDAADDDTFYLCPICGYIHKGEDFERCPICFAKKEAFTAF